MAEDIVVGAVLILKVHPSWPPRVVQVTFIQLHRRFIEGHEVITGTVNHHGNIVSSSVIHLQGRSDSIDQ